MTNNPLVKSGERVDDLLVNELKIIQNPSAFCFGCDAVELANFVTGGAKDYAVDLGSGTGIITLLLAGKKGIRTTG
ncbi:MAG: methyltransferase, partial [Clostridia bacterium]|nr:methyltransferase [Clostridia bacterium]